MNTEHIVKKANARMELIRRVAKFNVPMKDLRDLYVLFVRSILEQSAPVWHSSITQENSKSIERVQKSAVRLILGNNYITYSQGLQKLNLQTLEDRRIELCLNFALKCSKDSTLSHMFPKYVKEHGMKTRSNQVFKVHHANTQRYKKSPIIFMQNLLNKEYQIKTEELKK